MAAQPRLARIALGHLVEPGNRDLAELVAQTGPVEALHRLCDGRVTARLRKAASARLIEVDPYQLAHCALELAERLGARIAVPEDEEWPAQLRDLCLLSRDVADPIQRDTLPPHCLWLRGAAADLAGLCRRSVAVIGARACTSYGEQVASDLGYGLVERGWTVVSGGALGVDAAAHRGALAGGGPTVVVLAGGIDRPYPLGHASLFERVVEHGLLLSEWPPGSDPHRRRFLIRNRVIAALTAGTVMVEANLRSGARFTLNRARDLGRAVLVVPGPVTSCMSSGCHEELRVEGAVLVTGVDHVVEAVGQLGVDLAPPQRAEPLARDQLTSLQRQVLDGVRPRKVLTAEQIAAAVSADPRDARRTLPGLEMAGYVVTQGGGYRLPRAGEQPPEGLQPPRPAPDEPP